jgi:SAM-dependent methyltransferase
VEVAAPSAHAELAYDSMAGFYDDFTAHHDYDLWLGSLIPAARRCGLRGRRVLDLGCGTGKSFLPLLRDGWRVTGADSSREMLAIAREKTPAARLVEADVRRLPRLGRFDLVMALDDVVNYLLDPAELAAAFAGARSNLAEGGLLVFDCNTLASYRTFFAEEAEVEVGGGTAHWLGRAPADTQPGAQIEAVVEHEGRVAVHRQRHHPTEVVLGALGSAGLRCLALYGHEEDAVLRQPFDELVHSKAIYIAASTPRR